MWRVIKQPNMYLHEKTIHDIVYPCIILHNMIIEDEMKNNLPHMGILEQPLFLGEAIEGSDEPQKVNMKRCLTSDEY